MSSFPYDNMGAPLYRNEQFTTPVKEHPPSFGYGNSSSPAYESPPTVGRSSAGHIDWNNGRFGHGKLPQKAHLLPPQASSSQYSALESSPPEPPRGMAGEMLPNDFVETNDSLYSGAAPPYMMHPAMRTPSNEKQMPQFQQQSMRRQGLHMQQQNQQASFQMHQQMLQQQAAMRHVQQYGYEHSPLHGKRNRAFSSELNQNKRYQVDPNNRANRAFHRSSSSASIVSSGSSPSPTSSGNNHYRHASVTGIHNDLQYAQRNAPVDRRLSVPTQHFNMNISDSEQSRRRSAKKRHGTDSRNEKQRITQHLINQERMARGEFDRNIKPHSGSLRSQPGYPHVQSTERFNSGDRKHHNVKISPRDSSRSNVSISGNDVNVAHKGTPRPHHGSPGNDLLPNEDISAEGISNFLNSDGIQDLLSDDYTYDMSPTAYDPFSDASSSVHSFDTTLQGDVASRHSDSSVDLLSPVSRLQPAFLPQATSTPKSSRLISSPFENETGGDTISPVPSSQPFASATIKKDSKSSKRRSKNDAIKPSTQSTPSRVAPLALSTNLEPTGLPSPATPSASSWSGNNNFSLYTENGSGNGGHVFSSKVFALACEKQNSLKDPKADIFKGDLEHYEPSKRHFMGKNGLQFSINHSGHVSVDALTPPLNSSENTLSNSLTDSADSTLSDDPSIGFAVAKKFFGDESDSESEADNTPKALQTPPRFSSLGNTDATTAFARTLSRAREGKGSTFLFPIENTPDKHGQLSSYAPSTPRAPATFQDTSFSMQTPPGAICNYENGDFYGTGMTPYFSANFNS